MDLYIAPRKVKHRINIDPKDLIPEIPPASELKPFPSKLAVRYKGHNSKVRSVSFSPCGRFLCSGDDDGLVLVFDVRTSRIVKRYKFEKAVTSVAWNPAKDTPLIAITTDTRCVFVMPEEIVEEDIS